MRPRFAFEVGDLAALLTLDVNEPGDVADIDAVYAILLRRGAPITAAPTGPEQGPDPGQEQGWAPRRARLHVVPDPM